jgi:hypothetical protein
MSVKAYITDSATGKIAEVSDNLDGTNRLHVDAVLDASNQHPIPVTFSLPGSSNLPRMVSLHYNQSIGAILANTYKRAVTYTVPVGWNGYLIRYSSFQAEVAQSRVISELMMGTLNIVTNVFDGGLAANAYTHPQWTGAPQFEIMQQIGSAANVTITIMYTNELGISARTATCVITKGSIVGGRWNLTLQAGDLGIQSVQDMSVSPTSSSGAVKLLGFVQLGYHEDGGVSALETLYAPGGTSFPSETVLGVEHQGGTVSKIRRFDVLLQLVRVTE